MLIIILIFSFLYSALADDGCPNNRQQCNQSYVAKQKDVEISVIDISSLLSRDSTTEEKNAIKIQIGKNCRSVGMFYITHHGLESIIKEFQGQVELFFESSKEVKNSVKRRANNSRGWADDEYTKRKIDTKEIFDFGHKPFENLPDDAVENIMLDGYNQWPKSPDLEKFRSVMESYYKACSELASILLSAIAYDLGIDPIIFKDSFSVNRHTDAGVLTLLMQDSNSALEVYSGTKQDNNDGEWIHVDPVEGGIAINVCDMLQVWSNDRYKAPEHRVRASLKNKRYSSPFFYNPNYDVDIIPFVENKNGDVEAKYDPINYGQFRFQRFNGDFADTGKEIQIEDFLRSTSSLLH